MSESYPPPRSLERPESASSGPVDASWPPPELADTHTAGPRLLGSLNDYLNDVLVIVGAFVVLGVVGGLLWSKLVDPAQIVRFQEGVGQDEVELARDFGANAWFVAIGAVGGLVAGLVLGFLRGRDAVVTVILVIAGAIVAAAIMAWTGQHLFGPSDPTAALKSAAVGAGRPQPLRVSGASCYLVWPLAAILGGLVPLLTRRDDA